MMLPYYKCCPKLVPEDSVRPETRTLVTLTRRKGFVGSLKFLFLIATQTYSVKFDFKNKINLR